MVVICFGKYGKLLVLKGYCCKFCWSIGSKLVGDFLVYIDWNVWLGFVEE